MMCTKTLKQFFVCNKLSIKFGVVIFIAIADILKQTLRIFSAFSPFFFYSLSPLLDYSLQQFTQSSIPTEQQCCSIDIQHRPQQRSVLNCSLFSLLSNSTNMTLAHFLPLILFGQVKESSKAMLSDSSLYLHESSPRFPFFFKNFLWLHLHSLHYSLFLEKI